MPTGTIMRLGTSLDHPPLWLLSCLLLFSSVSSPAQEPFEVFHSFTAGGIPKGSLLQTSDGKIYGTSYSGGLFGRGSVFMLMTDGSGGWIFSTLHSFNDIDGSLPIAGLIQAKDGNFYGTTSAGGEHGGGGTVFRIDSSGNLTTLHTFDASNYEGASPAAPLIQAQDGDFYGTTTVGGANFLGTVFKIDASGTFSTLHSFNYPEGTNPNACLVQGKDGQLYGTCASNGTGYAGTVFRVDSSGTVTTIHSFDPSEGRQPYGALVQAADGNFYGTTSGGGSDNGTIFRMDASGTVTKLHSFTLDEGFAPYAGLIQAADGNFYGTTTQGGAAFKGTVFRIGTGGTLSVLHSLAASEGIPSGAALIQAQDRKLYGT